MNLNLEGKSFSHQYYRLRRRALITFRKIRREHSLVIVGSAHKVGSTWLYDLVSSIYGLERFPISPNVLEKYPGRLEVDLDIPDILPAGFRSPYGRFIHKSHALPPPEDWVSHQPYPVRILTIIRDPRDAITSAIFYLAELPEEKGGWGQAFRKLDEVKKIKQVIENGDFLIDRLKAWFEYPMALKIRYEDLKTKGVNELKTVATYLGYEVNPAVISYYYNFLSFENMKRIKRRGDDVENFYRKGISGDWKNYFDKDCIEMFKNGRNGEWQELLLLLGYENDKNW